MLQGRALFSAPVQEPHLLPFYARVAASLAQVFPDVAAPLLRSLEEEFAELKVQCPAQALAHRASACWAGIGSHDIPAQTWVASHDMAGLTNAPWHKY